MQVPLASQTLYTPRMQQLRRDQSDQTICTIQYVYMGKEHEHIERRTGGQN